MELKGKVALVTGGAVRLGRAIVTGLANEGVRIGLHHHSSAQKAKQLKSEIERQAGDVFLLPGDFSKVAEIEKVVDACHQHFKQIDILINNAAVYFRTPLGVTTQEEWDRIFTINLKAPFFCAQAAARIMRNQKGGKIINIADVAGVSPWSNFIPYSASKAGIISMTKGMAKALAPGIQVNAIAPGTILSREDATEEEIQSEKDKALLRKIGSPEDIVNTVLFLLKGSDFVTGAVIVVDGGKVLK